MDETPWNKLCVYLIVPYKIFSKGKDPLVLKSNTMIEPVIGWLEATQYDDNKLMTIRDIGRNYMAVQVPLAV